MSGYEDDEGEMVHAERDEARCLRDAEDGGWWRLVAGTRMDLDDIPSGDEL